MTLDAKESDAAVVAEFESLCAKLNAARDAVRGVIIGQDRVVDEALIAVASGGHALLVGAPGLAKTLLVQTVAAALGLDSKRIQFTPDLMPGDILGSEVLEETENGSRAFRFIKGPVFCQLLMADEINRASPRTQSALLQAMQERHVTIAGQRYELPRPFHVLATQNPLEQEGTYPLPEAQLDRFLMEIDVDFPGLDAERRIIVETSSAESTPPPAALSAEELIRLQHVVRRMPVGDRVVDAILALTRSARPESSDREDVRAHVAWGPGPRAGQALMLASRARALLDGRFSPSIDDVTALAPAVLRHRIALRFTARAEGVSAPELIEKLCESLG
ncbi:MAG: MoxR family ATPase [Parvularculaceae bacterium]